MKQGQQPSLRVGRTQFITLQTVNAPLQSFVHILLHYNVCKNTKGWILAEAYLHWKVILVLPAKSTYGYRPQKHVSERQPWPNSPVGVGFTIVLFKAACVTFSPNIYIYNLQIILMVPRYKIYVYVPDTVSSAGQEPPKKTTTWHT